MPAREALQLCEIFAEIVRLELELDKPEDYRAWMNDSLTASVALEKALQSGDKTGADTAFSQLTESCAKCHDNYRN